MSIDIYEILGDLNQKEGLLRNNPFLGATTLLSKDDILKLKIPDLTNAYPLKIIR